MASYCADMYHGEKGIYGTGGSSLRPYGEATVFVDALKNPMVVIHATGGVTIVSAADSIGAERLAARLRLVANRERQVR